MATLRAVAALLGFYAAVAALVVLVVAVTPRQWWEGTGGIALSSGATVLGVMSVSVVQVRRGWATWGMLGWPDLRQSLRGLGFGIVLGLAMAAVAVALAIAAGTASLSLTGERAAAYASAAIRVGLVLLTAALAEEVLFRPFQQ